MSFLCGDNTTKNIPCTRVVKESGQHCYQHGSAKRKSHDDDENTKKRRLNTEVKPTKADRIYNRLSLINPDRPDSQWDYRIALSLLFTAETESHKDFARKFLDHKVENASNTGPDGKYYKEDILDARPDNEYYDEVSYLVEKLIKLDPANYDPEYDRKAALRLQYIARTEEHRNIAEIFLERYQ